MYKYEFNLAGSELYNFIWEDFCSNYIEYSKFNLDNLSTKSTLCYILTGILKMWLLQSNAERNGGIYENRLKKENLVSGNIADFSAGDCHNYHYFDSGKICAYK